MNVNDEIIEEMNAPGAERSLFAAVNGPTVPWPAALLIMVAWSIAIVVAGWTLK